MPPDTRQGTAAVGDDDDHDLAGARSVGYAHLHGVETAAHIGSVLVAERQVELAAQAAALLRTPDQGRALAEQFTVVVVAMNPVEDAQIIASPCMHGADGQGRPLGFVLTGGETSDYSAVPDPFTMPVK
ncbi:hypothetical protein GGD56_006019 [Rhizobium mongolense]|uniref:Uncharacterized protein n=1 Tax=Rhizobium mongolense TaxID=57676 RepID=A0ABR6IW72_9HYPH|nr:hypothetical protein [Rhizobium mongolense]